ncbi:DNA-directed RNA polymerase I subunit RPA49-like isoform X2 [Centruroides vittatus]
MEYVGYNFGPEAPRVSSLCQYFVGVLNKKTKCMKLHKTQLFNLRPVIEVAEKESKENETTYREKVDQLTKKFGSKIKKGQLESRLQHSIGTDDMEIVAAKAIEEAKEESLNKSNSLEEKEATYSEIIPPQDRNAFVAKNVYKIQDIISDAEYNAIEPDIFLNASKDQITEWQQQATYGVYIIDKLKTLPIKEDVRKHKAKLLTYFYFMMQLANLKARELKRKDPLPSVPTLFKEKILDKFTSKSTNQSGKLDRSFPNKMKDKLAAHALVLALFVDEFEVNLNQIQPDLKIPINRLATLAGALGCKVVIHKDQLTKRITKTAILTIPLYVLSEKTQKRRT